MTTAALPRDATVAVIGAGAMGSGIAQIAAQAGHPVRLFDTRMGAAEKSRAAIAETLASLAAKGWHVCDHGIYTRDPDGQLQAEPEAC